MSLGKRLIKVGLPACLTDTTDIFGDSSGVALYSLDYDASDESGTYDGAPTDVEFGVGGQINYGARFNGSSSRIENIDTTPLSTATSFSVSAWIKTTSTSRNFIYGDTKYINNTILGIDNNRIEARSVSSPSVFSSTLTISDGNWHNIVMTVVSGGAFKVYFDNSEVINTTVGTFSSASGYQTIAVYRSLTPTYIAFFNGDIDQVRIFNKALSSSEVSTLYAETACVYDCTTDTTDIGGTNQSYYKFDNDVLDYSGNGNDGTSSSMVFSFGKFGQAAIGDNTTRNFVNPQPFNTGDTISFWTKRINAAGGSSYIFGQHDGYYDFATCRVYYNNDNTHKIQLYVRNSASEYRYTQTSYVADNGNWSHWVITLNSPSSNPTVYLNSVQQSVSISNSSASVSSYAQSNARIGRGYLNGTVYNMNGYLDQMRTFTSARTTDQVSQLYNEKQCLDTVTAPTGNLRFDEFWAGYDDGQSNRAEFKSSGQIVDFNTQSEGHAVLNQNAQTSGKYYLEIKLVNTSGHEGFGVFNRSTNIIYDSGSPFGRQKSPVDANYGATLYAQGSIVYVGNVSQSGFTNLSLGAGDIVCMAVNVDEKRIWWGRRDGLSDSSITWNSGNPNGGYGGLEVSFVPSDVIVMHVSESVSRFAEFEVLNHADMLEAPFNFSYLDGPNTASLTENESNF